MRIQNPASFQWILLLCNFILPILSLDGGKEEWMKLGRSSIEESLAIKKNEGVAKNGILFIGDGMGLTTITAARIFKGQLAGHTGEEGYLTFEKFGTVGLVKTYNVDRQVPDSAGTATALFSGVKGNYYTVGLDGSATFNVCRTDVEAKSKVESIIDWAIAAGKSTGVVTTTRITHATPAAAYANSANRDWECDSKIPESERNLGCKDIARQLVEDEPGRNINVIMGGGEQVLRSKVNESTACVRGDGKDLAWTWMQTQRELKRKYRFVRTKDQLLDEGLAANTDYLLGLFAPSHIPYDKERTPGPSGHPSLEEMTQQAIKILSKNPKGFLLIVEGGRVDHAHHDNLAQIALEEVLSFDKAITTALKMTKEEDTIVVVTADHSHAMTMNGYPARGNPITGVGDKTPEGFTYQTLSYMNGPGYNAHRITGNLPGTNSSLQSRNTWKDVGAPGTNATDRHEPHLAGFWMDYETHGGEDVPVYSNGPMSHLLHGVHEQTHIPYSMAYSLCIGPYAKQCRPSGAGHLETTKPNGKHTHGGTGQLSRAKLWLVFALFFSVTALINKFSNSL